MALPTLPPPRTPYGGLARRPLLTPAIKAQLLGALKGGAAGGGAAANAPQERGPGSWNMPDYASLLAGDPSLMSAIAQIAASGAASGREKMMASRRAVTQFGEVPTGAPIGDIDEATRLAAGSNPLSTVRQLEESRGRNRADLAAALAGRGMLQSGALVGGEQQIQTGYERARGTATQQLLDALSGYETSHAQAQRELALAEMEAREAAASRVMGTYLPQWMEGSIIAPPAAPTPTPLPPPPTNWTGAVGSTTLLNSPEMIRKLQAEIARRGGGTLGGYRGGAYAV
jgi:hypothetical protein